MHEKTFAKQSVFFAEKAQFLTKKVINWFVKCFSYAVSQNKGNAVAFKQCVASIVPHAFGSYENCGHWCGYQSNPAEYYHKSLPHGEDLTGEVLHEDLSTIFSVLERKAERIAPGGSTKELESFNHMIATKASKSRHYSSSESLATRVGCAVLQKNEVHLLNDHQ